MEDKNVPFELAVGWF